MRILSDFEMMTWFFICFVLVFLIGSVWAYYRYFQKQNNKIQSYKLGGNMLTFVFTLPLSFAVAAFVKVELLKVSMQEGGGLTMIFILTVVISNYVICLLSASLARGIIRKRSGKL